MGLCIFLQNQTESLILVCCNWLERLSFLIVSLVLFIVNKYLNV